ncbi:putative ATPase/DNA-binding winged helix-turn-helix (wHTH) protein [Oxalobacteraceae bacterium GrIS 1.11]
MEYLSLGVMSIEFGRFTLLPHRRVLRADGRLIELGGRAVDILTALVAQPGAVLSHDYLLGHAWRGEAVEGNNLQVQISALRKALGGDRGMIRTVVGRGYQFVGRTNAVLDGTLVDPPGNLPAPMSRLIGRDQHLQEATALLMSNRLLTLIGGGGIGKTRLGLALARCLAPAFADGVWCVELGALAGPELVNLAAATALGLDADGPVAPESIAALLGKQQVLLLLDGCEHVAGAATSLVEAVLRRCPGVRIMATSRERLHIDGETVYRVPPLGLPDEQVSCRDLLSQSGAVQLFCARAYNSETHCATDLDGAALIGAICRRLDGIPLAIEFAAARAPALGVERLATGHDDLLQLLVGGHRSALPRHRTFRATLDWSYALLAQRERIVLRRLAIFPDGFTLDGAFAVAGKGALHGGDMLDCITSLVAKSLIEVDFGLTPRRYRLLETTQAYARSKLRERGEYQLMARLHEEYCRSNMA